MIIQKIYSCCLYCWTPDKFAFVVKSYNGMYNQKPQNTIIYIIKDIWLNFSAEESRSRKIRSHVYFISAVLLVLFSLEKVLEVS